MEGEANWNNKWKTGRNKGKGKITVKEEERNSSRRKGIMDEREDACMLKERMEKWTKPTLRGKQRT